MSESLEFIYPNWNAPAQVRAVVSTRCGGVSQAPWDSLNLATHVGDDPAAVVQNRQRLQRALDLPSQPLWLEQVHGIAVADAATACEGTEADASVALCSGPVCAVMTADCLPVLLCDRQGSRVAAVHAGWRGLLNGVIEAAVARLAVPADQLMAWMGPAIGPAAFEVGNEVREAFLAADAGCAPAFVATASAEHFLADLYALASRRLKRLGVASIQGGEYCSYTDKQRFFSYRRDGQCGRMASLIWLAAP